MSILSEMYKAEQRQRSASILYAPAPAPVAKRSPYVASTYQGLSGYRQEKPSQFEQAPGESDAAYTARLRPFLQHLTESLPAAELDAVAKSYNEAITRLENGGETHDELRARLAQSYPGSGGLSSGLGSTSVAANGIGIFGSASPQERAQALGSRGHGIRDIPAQGQLRRSSDPATEPDRARRPARLPEHSRQNAQT